MYEVEKKNGRVFMSKFVGTGPSAYEKRIYWATVSQILRNAALYQWMKEIFKWNTPLISCLAQV